MLLWLEVEIFKVNCEHRVKTIVKSTLPGDPGKYNSEMTGIFLIARVRNEFLYQACQSFPFDALQTVAQYVAKPNFDLLNLSLPLLLSWRRSQDFRLTLSKAQSRLCSGVRSTPQQLYKALNGTPTVLSCALSLVLVIFRMVLYLDCQVDGKVQRLGVQLLT